jgi:hypothetical protein
VAEGELSTVRKSMSTKMKDIEDMPFMCYITNTGHEGLPHRRTGTLDCADYQIHHRGLS